MRFFHQKTLTPETFHKQSAQCTPKTLRHQQTLQGKPFATTVQQSSTPDDSYDRNTLHQGIFTAEGFYPDLFTPNNFCTRNRFIKTGILFYTFFRKEPLYQRCWTPAPQALYTKEFSQNNFIYTRSLCTKQFLRQKLTQGFLEQEPFTPRGY